MSYVKQGFVDLDENKPLLAAQLIAMEDGIIEAQEGVKKVTPSAPVVGQYLRIKSISEDGKILEVESADAQGPQGAAGADGFSPTVSISKSGKVTTVTVTDATGPHTATINDGEDGAAGADGKDGAAGANGSDGVSPTVEISKSGKVTTITITDATGPHTATINDGEDGGITGSIDGLPEFTEEDIDKFLGLTADGPAWLAVSASVAMTNAEEVTF